MAKKRSKSKKKYQSGGFTGNTGEDVGGVLQSLLPIADAFLPGVGTGASALTGIITSMLAKEPGKPLNESKNPFAMKKGGELSNKISKLIKEGYDQDQAVAIAHNMMRLGGLIPTYKKGGIHIKESKKGTFTKAAKKRDMGVQEFARKVLSNKDQYSSAMVKKANFARNAKKWNNELGGEFKQYNAPMHQQGGQTIDANGNPTGDNSKAVAEIEGRENMLVDKSGRNPNYIFSDFLDTSDKAAKINKKMKGDDEINRRGRRVAFSQLKRENEAKKKLVNFLSGGKYQTGGPFDGNPVEGAYKAFDLDLPQAGYLGPIFDPNMQSASDMAGSKSYSFNYSAPGNIEPPAYREPATDPANTVADNEFIPNNAGVRSPMDRLPTVGIPAGVQAGAYATPRLPTPLEQRNTQPLDPNAGNLINTDDQPFTDTPQTEGQQEATPTGNNLGSILKGAAYIGSAIDAFQPYEREQTQFPDFSRGDRLVRGTGTGFQALANEATGAANQARETARASSRNVGQFINRQRAISSSLGRNLGQLKLQESQYKDQLAMQRAARSDRNEAALAGERIRAQVATSQNRARRQDLIKNFMNDVNNLGTEIQRQEFVKQVTADMSKNLKRQFMLDLMATNMQNPNFQIENPDKYMKLLDEGKMEEAMKMIKFRS